ncbi:hypothetical protein RF644_14875 [Kocuria sp. CPCC 205258]|uniref:hypothetical protein n=1 Tax=Kocuria sp. CPCC 205258 TaxID=3073552 RepID=UPI0034D65A72
MANVALLDLVRHFVVRGENLGTSHPALAALRVIGYDSFVEDLATTVRGRCEFNGSLRVDTTNGLSVEADVDEAAPAFDPADRGPVFDIRETAVDFELLVPRAGSALVAQGVTGLGTPAAFAATRAALDVLANPAPGPAPGDYPATDFTLDLVLEAPKLRPPFLQPAKLNELGLLSPDPDRSEVEITLPRLRFRISQAAPGVRIELVSAGSTGLDDPGDIGVAELISMDPPYAFIGGRRDRMWGMGFRSATLDLSGDFTPASLKDKAGVGDDWTGLYLPEARVFVSPAGERDLAFEAGAQELLIGMGASSGIWGDFEAVLVQQGSAELGVTARFADENGRLYGTEPAGEGAARARLPRKTQMVVDVSGGRAPYEIFASVGGAAETSGRVFVVDMGGADSTQVEIRVTSPAPDAASHEQTLSIAVTRLDPTVRLDTPGPQATTATEITVGPATGALRIVVISRRNDEVVLATDPRDSAVRWTVAGDAETGPSTAVTVPVAAGATVTVRGRRPATTVSAPQPFYFTYDAPAVETDAPDVWTTPAVGALSMDRLPGGAASMVANSPLLAALPPGTALTITGQASFEGHTERQEYNFLLARRRAESVRRAIGRAFPGRFTMTVVPPSPPGDSAPAWAALTGWTGHGEPTRREWWRADVALPSPAPAPELTGEITLTRPSSPLPTVPPDPEPETPATPDWFRSAGLKVRVVASELIALELSCEIDVDTVAEERLRRTGQLPAGSTAPDGRALQNGSPVGPENPADGIMALRVLAQSDPATGRNSTLITISSDPSDKDGLYVFGWIPGDPGAPTTQNPASPKDFPRTLLGSYLTFWPLLAQFPPVEAGEVLAEGGPGGVVDATLAGAALVAPGVIAALPWFQVERVVVFGAEYDGSWRDVDGRVLYDGRLLFDIGIDWSADLLGLVVIRPQFPLSVRYKAIGLRFGNTEDDGGEGFVLRPIFDSARGYTIDLASGGSVRLIDPLGQILKILGARISEQNPLTLEIEIGLGVDLGVVSIDKAGLRVYLDEDRPPELTALAATVDIPGALLGSGYVKIGKSTDPEGNAISVIAGQLDLTLRPIGLRVAAALAVAQIPPEAGGPATGIYVGLNVVLPVGVPLGNSGIGIFGFRGIFGMHYQRNPQPGIGSTVPSLAWLEAAGGQPHLLEHNGVELWTPAIDRWAFGLGMLIGTMEGGIVLNLDGTFLLELPGPRVLILLNARIVSPPPALDGLGQSGGVLAVIEITPEHFLIGIVLQWSIEHLVTIVVPVEAVFPFGSDAGRWHVHLGARPDVGRPVTVDVLGIVKGTGYLMFRGDGLPAFPVRKATLPEISGFAIGLGAAASFTWGDTGAGLYLRVGGGFDAVVGLAPFIVAGTLWLTGELRLFIVSVGADAQVTVVVNEQPGGDLAFYAHGEACGHVDFFFFSVEGCVDITLNAPAPPPSPVPRLVDKVSLKSRSPALLAGTGVDRGIDTSLGDAVPGRMPAADDPSVPVVPIDVVPVISMHVPPTARAGLTIDGLPGAVVPNAPGLLGPPDAGHAERSGERYRYEIVGMSLERIDPGSGAPLAPAVTGTVAPLTWWALNPTTEPSPVAQLALLTWDPVPATKAIEKTEHLVETVVHRWGHVCRRSADPAEVLWTFRFEPLGPSGSGWELSGIAWPDAADTVRTSPPDVTLPVTERWRSGDAQLDGMRGVVPALVVGAAVPCRREDVPGDGPRLVVGGRGPVLRDVPSGALVPTDDPAFGALVRSAAQEPLRVELSVLQKVRRSVFAETEIGREKLPAPQVLERIRAGEAVPLAVQRAALASLAAPAKEDQRPGDASCLAKVLQPPALDDGQPIAVGDPRRFEEVSVRLDELGVFHGPLDDVVLLRTGGVSAADVLLFVGRGQLERRVVVRVVAEGDRSLEEIDVDGSHRLTAVGLPGRWDDPAGPWAADVDDVLLYARLHRLEAFLVHVGEQPEAVALEVGTRPEARNPEDASPAYWLAACGVTRWAEVRRHEWDRQQQDNDREIITKFLEPSSTEDALLKADSLYRLTVSSWGTRKGDGVRRGSEDAPDVQAFWFRTDAIADGPVPPPADPSLPADPVAAADVPALHFTSTPPLPVRLDPWMLVTLPGDGETHAFTDARLKLVFSTADIERILAEYGKEMRLHLQAASGRHPLETTDGHPLPAVATAAALKPVGIAVLTPYEEALLDASVVIGERSGSFCVPIDSVRARHREWDIPILLDRATGYILDVELVDQGAAADARGPRVLRRQFSTGMHRDFDDLADSLAGVRIRGQGARPGAIAGIAAAFAGRDPAGAEFDAAWAAAGFQPLETATEPRVTVLWEQADTAQPPQPTGLLLEATAPLTRLRPYPTKVTDDSGPVPATRWALAERSWLTVLDASDAGVVSRILRSPGADRYLVILRPGARGRRTVIDLVEPAFADLPFLSQVERRRSILEVRLDRAPWEEQ